MKKGRYVILALILFLACWTVLFFTGRTYVVRENLYRDDDESLCYAEIETRQGKDTVEIVSSEIRGGQMIVKLKALEPGKSDLILHKGIGDRIIVVYTHRSGILTLGGFFGDCRGGVFISVAAIIFIAAVLYGVIREFSADVRDNLYQYKNIRNLGWIIYFTPMLIAEILMAFNNQGLEVAASSILNASTVLSFFTIPIAVIVLILVTISCIRLVRREGRTPKNMLAVFLSLIILVGTILPFAAGEILQRQGVINVFNEKGPWLYIELFLENSVITAVTYLECILLATIILAVIAAKRIPAFDRDYILILGSRFRKDGTLTPLLKGRADRAVEFAKMQKEASGKDLFFVPSGGQGKDEVMAEAEAIGNYLLSQGIPAERILKEDRSANTYENFGNSIGLIREHSGREDAKIAFSTTNYHVFRSGIYATQQGIRAEGIGSPTKRYFWINAFVREFIATVVNEKRKHLKVILIMIALVILLIFVHWLSVFL